MMVIDPSQTAKLICEALGVEDWQRSSAIVLTVDRQGVWLDVRRPVSVQEVEKVAEVLKRYEAKS